MGKSLQKRRVMLLVAVVVLAFTGLGYRLVDLQVLRHDELLAKAQRNTQRDFMLVPRRGDILDAHGNLLATSIFVKTVCANPVLIGTHQAEVAHAIAPLLQLDEADLRRQLTPRVSVDDKGQPVTNRYVRLKQKVATETWQQVYSAMTNLTLAVDERNLTKSQKAAQKLFLRDLRKSAIYTEPVNDQVRQYPNGSLAANLLGFVSADEMKVNGRSVPLAKGCDGIEKSLDQALNGGMGWRSTEADSRGNELVSLRGQELEARDGLNVVLTIDAQLQHILETELANAMKEHAPASVTGLIMNPRTGEILAMATLPSYDPNQPNTVTTETRNRVITDLIEPGSTFKTIVISAALNEHVVTLDDTFFCENGAFQFGGHVLHDAEGHRFGNLTVADIIMHSSNIGAAKVGIKLQKDKLSDYLRAYGFGAATGIQLPGEVGGARLFPSFKYPVSIAQVPMGQGVAVTRLQMTLAFCAIANGGWLMQPMLVSRIQDRDGNVIQQFAPQRVRQVVSEATSKQMIEALKAVVTKAGTAPGAALTNYVVAGKTGTAQKPNNETHTYFTDKYIASFIGFFPADNPELCISIVMDEPKEGRSGYGGKVCAPVFKQVAVSAASYLNIRPDLDPGQTGKPATEIAGSVGNTKPIKTVYARTIAKP